MPQGKKQKTCFVIAPIGEEMSDTRKRSDQILHHIIEPAVAALGYAAIRADRIADPGIINTQVIQHIVNDDLAIADMTDSNPNVFYELAIRHAFRKPVILLIEINQTIPFDVRGMRAIQVDHHDLDSAARCRADIASQIRAIESNGEIHTPIAEAINVQQLQQSDDPLETGIADIKLDISAIAADVSALQTQLRTLARASDLPRMSAFSGVGSGTVNHGLGTRPDLIMLQSADGSPITYDSLNDISVHVELLQSPTQFSGVAIAMPSYESSAQRSSYVSWMLAYQAKRAVQEWLQAQYPGSTVNQPDKLTNVRLDLVVMRPDDTVLGVQIKVVANESAVQRIVEASYVYADTEWHDESMVILICSGPLMAYMFRELIAKLDQHKSHVIFILGYVDDTDTFHPL